MEANSLAVVAALALLLRIGHTLHTMGAVRARNVASVAARSVVCTACVILSIYFVARAASWMNDSATPSLTSRGMLGDEALTTANRPAAGLAVYFASPLSFLAVISIALLPTSLAEASTAERARLRGLVVIAFVLTVLVLPLVTSLGWAAFAEFDRPRGDGTYGSAASLSAVVGIWPLVAAHLVAGAGALALANTIGPRDGKYNRDGSANIIPAHNVPMLIAGDMLLMLGIPLQSAALAGDPAARTLNALLAASAATLASVVASWPRERRIEAITPWHAAIAGLVVGSIGTPLHPFIGIVLAGIVGLVVPLLSRKLDLKVRIDEPSGLALPHLLGALAGLVAVTVDAALEGSGSLREALLLGSIAASGGLITAIAVGAVATVVAIVLRQIGWLRVDQASEAEGLDLSQHDVNAYPDFQQTLIKSYHLRQ